MRLFDIVKQHDDVADDDSDKASDTEKCHEPKRYAHDPEGGDRADNSKRRCREYKEWLDGVLKLHEQREEDTAHGNQQYDREITESTLLLVVLAAKFDSVSRWQRTTKLGEFRHDVFGYVRCQCAGSGES